MKGWVSSLVGGPIVKVNSTSLPHIDRIDKTMELLITLWLRILLQLEVICGLVHLIPEMQRGRVKDSTSLLLGRKMLVCWKTLLRLIKDLPEVQAINQPHILIGMMQLNTNHTKAITIILLTLKTQKVKWLKVNPMPLRGTHFPWQLEATQLLKRRVPKLWLEVPLANVPQVPF